MTLFQNEIFVSKAAAHGVWCITVQDELRRKRFMKRFGSPMWKTIDGERGWKGGEAGLLIVR